MRFSLRTLLLTVAVLWSALAVFGILGFVLALMVLAQAASIAFCRNAPRRLRPLAIAILMAMSGLWLFVLVLPARSRASPTAWRAQCRNNLKHIGLALLSYHDAHGSFPPAYVPDAAGKPMHSWRVLILPFIEQERLYAKYNFDEPWDGLNNRKLADELRYEHTYTCPGPGTGSRTGSPAGYMALVGAGTTWPGAEPIRLDDIRDDPAATIIVVEVTDPDFNWMEPVDLSTDQALAGVRTHAEVGIGSAHRDAPGFLTQPVTRAHALCVDGSLLTLPEGISPEIIGALITIDGKERIPHSAFELPSRLSPTRCAVLFCLIVSITLLILWRDWRGDRGPQAAPAPQPELGSRADSSR